MAKNRKSKRKLGSGGRSHVVKTTQERSDYDDLVRTAPATDPTDDVKTAFVESHRAESVESQSTEHTGVPVTRSRIATTSSNIPWPAIGTIFAGIILIGTVVASYVSLKSKVEQIDLVVIESKMNTEKMRDDLAIIRERVIQLEVKVDTVHLAPGRSEEYSREIENIKTAIIEMQSQSKALNEVDLRQLELRVELLEKELSQNKERNN